MTTRVDGFVDTNVLLAATARSRPKHTAALALVEAGARERSIYLSGQVIREYLSVATRPATMNGLGLPQDAALANARQLLDRAVYLPEDQAVGGALLTLLASVPCLGKQVHDANIAATMIAHGVKRLVTLNPGDFHRYATWIEVTEIA